MTRAAEVMIAAASYLTSLTGAFEQISESKALAFLLASGLQLMLYASAHAINQIEPIKPGRKYSPSLRLLVWALCLGFSAWLSYIGVFKISKAAVETANQGGALSGVAHKAAVDLNQLRSDALSFLNAQVTNTKAQIASENANIAYAQKHRRPYSRKQLTRLIAEQQQLAVALRQMNDARFLDHSEPSNNLRTVRQELSDAFRQAATVYAMMPEGFRQSHPLPQPESEPRTSSDVQALAWNELRKGSPAALFYLFVALILDLVPTFSVRARTQMRRATTVVRDARLWVGDLFRASFGKLAIRTETVRLVVEGYRELDVEIVFGTDNQVAFLHDLQPHLELVERAVSDIENEPMRVVAITSPSGLELFPDLPLAAQLDDRTIHLRLEPVREEVRV
jgi:hypothetical protein